MGTPPPTGIERSAGAAFDPNLEGPLKMDTDDLAVVASAAFRAHVLSASQIPQEDQVTKKAKGDTGPAERA